MTTAELLKRARHTQILVSVGKGSIGSHPSPRECDMLHYTVDACRIWASTDIFLPVTLQGHHF